MQVIAGMKKQRPSQHGGEAPNSGAKPAIHKRTDDNEHVASPKPSSTAFSESTVSHLFLATEAPDDTIGSSSSGCIPTTFNTPADRSGQVVKDNGDGTFTVNESFHMGASFNGSYPGVCSCCEYRQYVKGYFQSAAPGGNWKHLPLALRWGVMLDPNTYNEDGKPNGVAYGYRDTVGAGDDYIPHPRTTGCNYSGNDAPGFLKLEKGYSFSAWLDFKGELIDVCNGKKVVQTKTWTVHLYGTV